MRNVNNLNPMKLSLLFLFTFCVSFASFSQESIKADLVPSHFEGISISLRDVPEAGLKEKKAIRKEHENESLEHPIEITNPNAQPIGEDPVLQKTDLNRLAPATATVLSNWVGLTASVQPSDNSIAVGPNNIMQMTNASSSTFIRIWNKAGTVQTLSKTVQSITGIADYGDPNVIYDEVAGRFVFVVLYSSSASKLVVCVSQTGDPNGSYYTYTFDTPNGFPDYPKIGVWNNSYFITTNSSSPTVYCLDRAKMLNGLAISNAQMFALSKFPRIGFQSASPVTLLGNTAVPAGAKATIMRVGDDAWGTSVGPDHLELFEMNIDWTTPANSAMTGPIKLNTAAYNSRLCTFGASKCIPQPTGTKLDPLSDIIMDKAQYRNFGTYESIVCSHVCNANGSGVAGVRWYELRRTSGGAWSIYQQSTYGPSTDCRWMSSVSINSAGAIALGYNISSSSLYPGIRITGRDSCSALNTMTVPEAIIMTGTASNSSSRYGDYNGLVCDPSDGSFWFTANYNPSSAWATNIVHFSIASCAVARTIAEETNSNPEFNNVQLVPNPSTGEVKLTFTAGEQNLKIMILDMTGKKVQNKEVRTSKGENLILMDLHELDNGYYFVNMQYGSFTRNEKLLIQH